MQETSPESRLLPCPIPICYRDQRANPISIKTRKPENVQIFSDGKTLAHLCCCVLECMEAENPEWTLQTLH